MALFINNGVINISEPGIKTYLMTCGPRGTFNKTITLGSVGYIGTGYVYGEKVYLKLTPTFGFELPPGTTLYVTIGGESGIPYAFSMGQLVRDPHTTVPKFLLEASFLPVEIEAL